MNPTRTHRIRRLAAVLVGLAAAAVAFGAAYESLDAQLEGLTVAERSLFEGSS